MQGLALTDYDNLGGPRVDSQAGAELHATNLVDTLASCFRQAFPGVTELDIRLYGGWTDEDGRIAPAAIPLLPVVDSLRGRRGGLIVRTSLAMALVEFPAIRLHGTVRLRARPRRQKMVDGMIDCDALYLASKGRDYVGIVTDDDDFVPAALSANAMRNDTFAWFRPRSVGESPNDQILIDHGVNIQRLDGGWK